MEAFARGGKFSLGCEFWQLPEIWGRGEGGVRGLGLCMAALVGLQYTGTLPTVHRYVLFQIQGHPRTSLGIVVANTRYFQLIGCEGPGRAEPVYE